MNIKNCPDPEYLSGIELIKEIGEAQGIKYIGSPTAGYASFDEESDQLFVLTEDEHRIKFLSLDNLLFEASMKVAKQLGASFTIYRNQVICNIQGISKAGETYSEAALRALLVHHRNNSTS